MDLGVEDTRRVLDAGAARECGLGLRQAHNRRRHTAQSDAWRRRAHRRHHDFGNRLSGAGADLAKPLRAFDRPDLHRRDELVGPAAALPVPGVKLRERDPALLTGASQHDHRLGGREHGDGVSRRRGVGDVAAECPAILDLHPADLSRCLDQHRQPPLHVTGAEDGGVGGQCADGQRVAPHRDAPEWAKSPEIDEAAGLQRAEIERHIEIGRAGQGDDALFVAQHAQGVHDGAGLQELDRRDGGSHGFRIAR